MSNKAELAEQAADIALQYEIDYGCCPQCVLAAVQETAEFVARWVVQRL